MRSSARDPCSEEQTQPANHRARDRVAVRWTGVDVDWRMHECLDGWTLRSNTGFRTRAAGLRPIVVQCACQAETEVRWSNNKNRKAADGTALRSFRLTLLPLNELAAQIPGGGAKRKRPARDRYSGSAL